MNASSLNPMDDTLCFELHFRSSRGYFFGESPFSSNTPLLLAQLTLCAVVTAVLHRVLVPLGQSFFVSQILTGVILGPSVLGSNPMIRDLLFPISSLNIVDTFAFFGVMFYLFIIGVKTDFSLIQKSGKRAVAIGICSFSIPLLLNFMLGKLVTHTVPMEPRLHMSLVWIATFQVVSSFHVIVCLLADLKLMNSELGRLAISSSMISGICSLLWTLIVFTGKQSVHVKSHTFLLMILSLSIMVFTAIGIFRPLVLWMIKHTNDAKSVKEGHICTIFIFVLASALYGEYNGQNFIFGPIILGMVIPDGPPLGSALVDKLELFLSSIILPIFFVVSAARIDFPSISLRNFTIIECLAVFALLGKLVGVLLPSLCWKMPMSDALNLGLILSNQGIMEVLILERAKSIELIDKESYSIMVISICISTGILAPIVKFSYKPSKRYATGELMTFQHANPHGEIRILACLHYQEHTPSIINLFEASYPHHQAPMCFYVVHLIELQGRSAPLLVAHHPGMRSPPEANESEHIINALRYFEHENRGHVTVYPFTAISPYASMHDDVCSVAADRRVSLVIVLFHKHPLIHVSEEESNAIRTVNCNIIKQSPSSVGILVDRGFLSCSAFSLLHKDAYRIGLIFLGGPDDREALAYACRMAQHPNIRLTLVRFVDDTITFSVDMELDVDAINTYKDAQMRNKQCFYQEETARDSVGFINVVRSMDGCFDLILVGRRHDDDSPLLAGLDDWNEFPELGVVGDMLVSLDSKFKASVLVVQQASVVRQNSSAVFEMLWPASRGTSTSFPM